MNDYKDRNYLSSTEAAQYLGTSVATLLAFIKTEQIEHKIATSGQKRFSLKEISKYKKIFSNGKYESKSKFPTENILSINNTVQKIFVKNSVKMDELEDSSVHLMVTSPPYFNAKMYSSKPIIGNLGNMHDLDKWFEEIGSVWKEVFRVLQPGRKAFINIMNLPVRDNGSFKTLNLAGKTIDLMEKIGFIFKRDIIWHKTNGVRAHFGTYPYPGGILINNMHEFILEFNKPDKKGFNKYAHLTKEQKEVSRLDKEFWLSIKNSDVWVMKPEKSGDRRSHVAPFPYELPHRLIKAFSFVGEIVLDPFLGSGTTLKAATDLGRNGVGYELIPEIGEVAIKRLHAYQSKLI